MALWQAGQRLTSARLNRLINQVVAIYDASAAQSIPPNEDTPVRWNRIIRDLVGGFDPLNPDRFLPMVPGWYEIDGGYSVEGVAGTQLQALLNKNGSANVAGSHNTGPGNVANSSVACRTSTEFFNGSTDFAQLRVRHNHTGSSNTATTLARRCSLNVKYVGPP